MIRARNPWHRMWPVAAVASIAIGFLASGCMWGTVRDPSGNPLAGVTVTYTDSNGRTASTTTNGAGEYVFGRKPLPEPPLPGAATFNLHAPGFAPLTETRNIAYDDNPNADIHDPNSFEEIQDFTLAPAAAPPSPTPPPMPGGGGTWRIQSVDLAVTDIFPDVLPHGVLYLRITNHGPDDMVGLEVDYGCSLLEWDASTVNSRELITPNVLMSLKAGETGAFSTHMHIDTSKYSYAVECRAGAPSHDPNPTNNSYTEDIP